MNNTNRLDRRCCSAAYTHAFLWGIGTGLFSSHLLRYLVRDLCHGQASTYLVAAFAWIMAAPRLAGVFRLFAPLLLDLCGNRKRFCATSFLAAPILLGAIPILLPFLARHARTTEQIGTLLTVLIAFWCLYHLAIYFGSVALFSWFGDLVPERIRGRFFGRREAWLVAGMTVGYLFGGIYSFAVIERIPESGGKWSGYLLPTNLALACFLISVLPLFRIPEIPWKRSTAPFSHRIGGMLSPMKDGRFAAFVFFGCWVQMSQALTQGAQYGFSVGVLGISMLTSLLLSTTTRVGQWTIGPVTGRLLDRLGSFPVMSISLLLAATGSLFYYFAGKDTWWLLFGAAGVWIFWVGVNIGITKTILDLAPEGDRSGHIAVYFTLTALTFAAFSVLGGHVIPREFERESFLWSFGLRLASVPILGLVLFAGVRRRSE